jgi:hypothetical protein
MNCYRCEADCWDLAWNRWDSKGHDVEVLQCAFCGALETRPLFTRSATRSRASVAAAPSLPPDGEFVFDTGRFAGKTIAEVVAHPSGRQYLDWAAKNVEKWTGAIESFMNHAAPSA